MSLPDGLPALSSVPVSPSRRWSIHEKCSISSTSRASPAGTWDPTLLMVFVGALPPMFLAYRVRDLWLPKPALAAFYSVPQRTRIDARLVGGSAIFGIGWGLAGVCPGPALTALPLAGGQLVNYAIFVAAMIAGIMLSWLLPPESTRPQSSTRSAQT